MGYNDKEYDRQRQYEEWQRYGKERGFFDRVSDEVRSWFGDEEAERRRQMDMQDRGEMGGYESPEWQRREYSGSSPRGSQLEPYGRYDASPMQEKSRRGWGMQNQPRRWGEDRTGRYSDEYSGMSKSMGSSYGRSSNLYGRSMSRGNESLGSGYGYGGRDWDDEPTNTNRPRFFDQNRELESGMSYGSDREYRDETMFGRYRGRGPRNYQRSDERISDEIHQYLTYHPELDATDVDVTVDSGIVTLKGAVDSRRAKRLAEDLSEEVFGVKEVHNELRVNRGDFSNMGPMENEKINRGRIGSF
jgi:osmotically-inducible protein OsmY